MYHKVVGITIVIPSFLFQYIFLAHTPHASMQREGGNKLSFSFFFSKVLFLILFFGCSSRLFELFNIGPKARVTNQQENDGRSTRGF